jgi:hypothetical protein
MANVKTKEQKLHSQLVEVVAAVMYWLAGLTRSFDYAMGLQPEDVIHINFIGYEQH